jgi:hypothetical protein
LSPVGNPGIFEAKTDKFGLNIEMPLQLNGIALVLERSDVGWAKRPPVLAITSGYVGSPTCGARTEELSNAEFESTPYTVVNVVAESISPEMKEAKIGAI